MIVIITGVPGVGKTTVLNEFLKIKPDFEVRNFADSMIEVAIQKGILTGNVKELHDQVRRLPPETQLMLQKEAGKMLGEAGKTHNLVIDTHAVVKTPKGYFAGLPAWVLENLKPGLVVLIEVDPTIIAKRRAEDPSRVRDQDASVEGIREHLMMCRAASMAYSTLSGCMVTVIENKQGLAHEAAEAIAKMI